jgi:cation diffusion facilitator CzcD-associated flavoprotein CzcO
MVQTLLNGVIIDCMIGHENDTLDAVVIGAGFAGICIGKRLLDAGIRSFRIFDKAPKVGGTWYWNSYPGAACDVMSHFYCYSFEPNPDWPRKYSPWNEIQAYSERCVDRYGLRSFIVHGKGVELSRFDDETRLWEVTFTDGSRAQARHVIDGTGALHVPLIPEIEGAESFGGEQWHSSSWRHDVDLTGKKVAVIGSAASAVQIVPEIAKTVARVSLFQRTANYVIPRYDRRYFAFEKWCFRNLPLYGKLYRFFQFLRYDWVAYPIVKTSADNIQRRYAMWQYHRLLRKSIQDPTLREILTPDYPIGCKRVLISDNFYTSLTRDNVSLITEGIERITPRGVRTADGVEHEADVVVYATGFDTQGHHTDQRIIGPNGKSLSEAWSDAPIAYEGCMVAGFPNYHFVTGPNTGVGSTSVIFMIEQAANMIIDCIKAAGKNGLIAPKEEAMQAYDAEIQAALAGTVWATSCSSWYKRDDGHITILYPYNAQTFRRRHKKLHREHFEING